MRLLILSADGFEDSELLVPAERFEREGIAVEIGSLARGPIRGKHGAVAAATRAIDELRADDYDALLVPGGRAPQKLCKEPRVLELVRAFAAAGKPLAAICHGPQVLLAAGVLSGRSATCYRKIAHELRAGGVHHRDAEVVVDGNLVTSRHPSDIPAFLRETLKLLRARGA